MNKKFDKMMARWEEKADKHFQSIKKVSDRPIGSLLLECRSVTLD
jgi:hypothetical protein